MPDTKISILSDDAIDFYTWRESQDFFYQRLDSEVVDYLNEFVSYDKLGELIESDVDTTTWEAEIAETSDIDVDSDTFEIVRTHMEAVIEHEREQ